MQLVSLYPFDPTGRATANRIENQSITVTPPTQITDYSYVVPRGAPFYADSLVVKDGRNVGARTLVENVDYWCVIDFLSASTALTKRVCVGIALLDPGYSGTLYITYQAVGGNYSLADYSVLEELIRERYVVKHVSYEQVINLPECFAPEWHAHEVADMVGMGQVVTMLDNIKVAINGRQGSYGQLNTQISNHVGSSAAHTPSQVGLSNVKNYDVATLAEATSGAGNKYVVASIMKQYVNSQMQDLSGFITTVTANATFATKAMLNSYSTTAVADGKYALKSDVYTKAQVNALIEGIDVSSSLGGFYTKAQSDGKYLLKTDISEYIKETVADGRYATKSSMSAYSTTAVADGKYALKTASYTKSESDGRYLGTTALSGYLTQSVADGRYQAKSAMDGYYTKEELNVVKHSRINWMPYPWPEYDYMMQLVVTGPAGTNNSDSRMYFNLDKHAKLTDVYTKAEVDSKVSGSNGGVYSTTFSNTISYRSYTALKINWTLVYSPSSGVLTVNGIFASPFYFIETISMIITLGAAPYQTTGVSDSTLPILYMSSHSATLTNKNDQWIYLTQPTSTLKANGDLNLNVSFSFTSSESNSYVPRMTIGATIPILTLNDHKKVMQWFKSSDKWVAPE